MDVEKMKRLYQEQHEAQSSALSQIQARISGMDDNRGAKATRNSPWPATGQSPSAGVQPVPMFGVPQPGSKTYGPGEYGNYSSPRNQLGMMPMTMPMPGIQDGNSQHEQQMSGMWNHLLYNQQLH